jgi:hypothetical protein
MLDFAVQREGQSMQDEELEGELLDANLRDRYLKSDG